MHIYLFQSVKGLTNVDMYVHSKIIVIAILTTAGTGAGVCSKQIVEKVHRIIFR